MHSDGCGQRRGDLGGSGACCGKCSCEDRTEDDGIGREKVLKLIENALFPVFSCFYTPEPPGKTAARVAKMWVEEFWHRPPPEVATFYVANANQQFVFSGAIPFSSWCAHHALPYLGNIWVAYRPKEELVYGLSKIPRLAQWAFHGLSLQEDATEILMEELWTGMPLDMCMVRVEAHHTCVSCRGVCSPSSVVTRLERGASPEDLQRFNFEIGR